MSLPAIQTENLIKHYDSFKALDGLTFSVRDGDFVSFLGPNGAGKTTTIHAITGLANFSAGSAKVFGLDVVRDYRQTRRMIGLCPQEFNFDPFLSLEQLLVYQAGYFGIPKRAALDRGRSLLRQFGLFEKKEMTFRKLSGGMKRRLLLCRALIHDPKILILDEPTAGADIELKYHIWEHLTELNKRGKTIFLTTHYMEEAEKLSNTVFIIHRGKLLHGGDKASLLQNETLEKRFMQLIRENADA